MSFNRDEFTDGYVAAMLWANTYVEADGELESLSEFDWEHEITFANFTLGAARQTMDDVSDFLGMQMGPNRTVHSLLGESPDWYSSSQAGHDFALTRNGHGAGFWDRGLGLLGELLTDAAKSMGETSLVVVDQRKVIYL